MIWLPLAIISYCLQGVTGAIDRMIVHRNVTPPIVISIWVALFSTLSLSLLLIGWLPLPFANHFSFVMPSLILLLIILIAGALIQLALYAMYQALLDGEATRVLSVIGALTPISTLLIAFVFLSERLGGLAILAFCLLIGGAVVLTFKTGRPSLTKRWLVYAMLSAVLFAAQAVLAKVIFTRHHFISAFALLGLGSFIYALIILAISPVTRRSLAGLFGHHLSQVRRSQRSQLVWVISNSSLGGLAIILLNLAIKYGSPSLVNSLRGVQYGTVFIIALLLKAKHSKLLDEELSRKRLVLKLVGLGLVISGVGLLALL